MRAVSIALFIFILSLSLSAVKEAYGLKYGGTMWTVDVGELSEAARVESDSTLYGYSIFGVTVNSVKALVKIISGAMLLGSTIAAFMPVQLPTSLTVGLNVLGATANLIAIAQFVRGVGTRVMD